MIPVRWIGGVVLLALIALAGLTAGDTERRVALVIGNASYRHVAPLANPRNDAEAVTDKLAGLGFSVTTALDMDLAALRARIEAFGRESESADVALVFYAGHGLQVTGENYLLPVDAKIEAPQDLAAASLRMDEIHTVLADAHPDLAVVILDACRDNPFVDAVAGLQGLASGNVFGSGEEARASDVLIAFAAAPGAVAADGVNGNSPFTTALLQWIDRPGLEIGTMFRRVRQTVVELTNGAQVPWVEESLLEDVYLNQGDPVLLAGQQGAPFDLALLSTIRQIEHPTERRAAYVFYDRVLTRAAHESVDELQATRASLEPGGESAFVQESLIWLSIRDSTDPAIFEAFLERFPDSTFLDLVRLRLAALAEGAAPPPVIGNLVELDPPVAEAVPAATLGSPPDEAARDRSELGESPGGLVLVERPESDARPPELTLSAPGPADTEAALALDAADRVAAQRLLAELGYYRGPLDGEIGPMSRSSVGDFQLAENLPDHGYLDQPTLRRLVGLAARPTLTSDIPPEARIGIHGLAAVALRGAGAEPTPIRVASIARHPDVHDYWSRIADAFEAEHPGTVIDFSVQPGADYKRNLLIMLGSETPPDIFYSWGGGHLRSASEAGFVRDLTPEMGDGWAMSFKPGALKNVSFGDRVYGAPMQMTLVSLWVNQPLLARAGVGLESLETWTGFLDAVRRLKESGITPLAVGGADRWPVQLYWGALSQGLGGPEATERALRGEGSGFASPPFVQAGVMLQDLAALEPFQPGFIDARESDAVDAFARGEVAMILGGDWTLQRMSNKWRGGPSRAAGEIRRVDFPPHDLGTEGPLTYGGTDAWLVRRDAPEEAVSFLRLLAGLDSQRAIAAMGYAIPTIAGADTALRNALLQDVAVELAASRSHQLFYDQQLGPEAGEVVNEVAVALLEGDLTPSRAAAEVDVAWQRVRDARVQGDDTPAPADLAPAN